MLSLERRLAELGGGAAAAAVLADAIPHAHPAELTALVTSAIETRLEGAVAAVVERFDRLSARLQEQVARAQGPFAEAIEIVLARGGEAEQIAAIGLIAFRGDAALSPLLGLLAASGRGEVAPRAAQALLDVVVGTCGRARFGSASRDASLAAIDEAVATAARAWRDRRLPEILLAAALLSSRPGPRLAQLLGEPDSEFARELRGVPALPDPLVRGNLIRWLGGEALGRSATRSLHLALGAAARGRRPSPSALTEVLDEGHLLLAPRRRRALRAIDRPLRCALAVDALAPLGLRSQLGAILLLGRLDLSEGARRDRVADLVASAHAPVRLRALEIAARHARPDWTAVTEIFCGDRSRAVARRACHDLAERARGDAGDFARLEVHARGRVARLLARASLRDLCARRAHLDESSLRAALACAVRDDRAGLVAFLRAVLSRADATERIWALSLLRRTRLVGMAGAEVMALALEAGDARVAATAIAALGEARTPERVPILASALRHADPRAAANALEALAHADRDLAEERAESLVESPNNRLRANAIVVSLRAQSAHAHPALRNMLDDGRPAHRSSALWAAKRSRDADVTDLVARRAALDDVPEIRARAEAVVRFLERCGAKTAARPECVEWAR